MCKYFDWKINVAHRVYYLRFILYISVKNINRWKVNLTFDCRTTYKTRPTVLNGYLSIREYTEWIIVAYRRYTGLVNHENEQNKSVILKYELNHNATLSWRICQFYNKNTVCILSVTYNKWKLKDASQLPYLYVLSTNCHLVIFLYRLPSSQNSQGKEGIETPSEYAPQFVRFLSRSCKDYIPTLTKT